MGRRILIGLLLVLGGIAQAGAEGSDARQRRAAMKANCRWTEAMGRQLYECVKRHDGMNAQWCHEEAMEAHCASGGAGTGAGGSPAGGADPERNVQPGAGSASVR